MGTLTIHGLDKETEQRVRAESKRTGLSMNRTVKRLLSQAVARKPRGPARSKRGIDRLFGAWSEEEYKEFMEAIKDFRKVDPEDWE
jgi:hypothetical protein